MQMVTEVFRTPFHRAGRKVRPKARVLQVAGKLTF